MMQVISFDIGGTDIKYGIIQDDYQILMHDLIPTEAFNGGMSIINRVIDIILLLKKDYPLSGVAISTAGIIDPFTGVVIHATNAIPGYIGINIKETIKQKTGLDCEVLNDVKCFALCEQKLGNALNVKNFITLTVGTGIGGAIYLNDQLIFGNGFSAGEWGRMIINGHKFEDVASVSGLIKFANQYIREDQWNGKLIFDLYDQEDPKAKIVVDLFYHHLATGIINLIYIFNPDVVIVGGGITARKDKFHRELSRYIQERIEPRFIKQDTLRLSKFSNHSGMLGALIHFQNMHEK
jgi:predicted NBD/HSP70 family sugar kinase